MDIALVENLEEVPADEWNGLDDGRGNPFLRHEFLAALERHGCVGEGWGWLPRHLLAREGGRLVGALPLYLKYNSYGEFVFDWAWADAYRRAGLAYYPKLVAGVPYTPVTGPRLLLTPGPERDTVADALVEGALELARSLRVSSLHWLFTTEQDTARLVRQGLMRRTGCQFHWENRGYRDFADFLDGFTAAKRKKLRRERRRVEEADVTIEVQVYCPVMNGAFRGCLIRQMQGADRGEWRALSKVCNAAVAYAAASLRASRKAAIRCVASP